MTADDGIRLWVISPKKLEELIQATITAEREAGTPKSKRKAWSVMGRIAEVAGLSAQQLGQWRKGNVSEIGFNAVHRLAWYFGVPWQSLCDDETPR